mmetsp:Transcript_30395/g.83739  ORF Transcript_30395/g.83739 Transcript_30395/m.83739 type:complete len:219 (-) Transcript_30395:468-1124(-)
MTMLPFATAYIKGVQPLVGSWHSTSAPCSSKLSTSLARMRWAAVINAGHSQELERSNAAPQPTLRTDPLQETSLQTWHRFEVAPHNRSCEASAMYVSARVGWRLLISSKSAPASNSISTNLVRLDMMATQRAFQSDGFAKAFTEAPCFSRMRATGSLPFATAYISGVQPLLGSRQSTAAPSSSNAATASACFRCAAISKGGHPLLSGAPSTSMRLLSS